MKEYVTPLAELQKFEICDVVTTFDNNNREPIETPDL